MSEPEVLEADLDSLNPKQKAKEFKATQKEFKSKDPEVRFKALQKFAKNAKYISEGGCLSLFLATLVPKKKNFEYLEKALTDFIEILKSYSHTLSQDNCVSQGLLEVLAAEGSLAVFQSLVEATTFKEEVKKPKVKKSKQQAEVVEEDPPENPIVVNIRALALKCWYYLWFPLIRIDRAECNQLCVALASISSVTTALCESISVNSKLVHVTEGETPNAAVVSATQNLYYATKVLVHTLRFQKDNIVSFLQHKLAGEFVVLAHNKEISLHIHQALHILSCHQEGVRYVASADHLQLLFQLAEEYVAKLKEIVVVPVEAAPVKGKEVKKDDKNKKGAQPVVVEKPPNPFEKLDVVSVETKRNFVCHLSLFTGIISEASQNCNESLLVEFVGRYLAVFHEISLNETVWECLRLPLQDPLDQSVDSVLEQVSFTIGQLCEISEEHRIHVCMSNGIVLLLSLLLASSKAVVVADDDREVKEEKLKQVRRLVEKSLIAASSSKTQQEAREGGRWKYANLLNVDKDIYQSFGADMLSKTVEAIACDDLDVSFRAVKFLSNVVCAISEDQREQLIAEFQIDKLSCGKLSHFVSIVATKLLEKEPVVLAHELDATVDEVLYLALAVVEIFLPLNADHIKTFADKSRLEVLCKLVDSVGITAANMSTECQEWATTIRDPRHYGWGLCLKDSSTNEVHQLRPLIIDVLRLVVESGEKYRTYEQALPLPTCTPLSVAASTCDEACFTTIKLFSDICVKVLLTSSSLHVVNEVVEVQVCRDASLSVLVRNAALRFLAEVGKTGALGLLGMMETVAAKGFSQEFGDSSMNHITQLLKGAQEWTDFTWKRPQFFSDYNLGPESNPCSVSFLQENQNVWPLLTLSAALLGVLCDPDSERESLCLALEVVQHSAASKHFDENSTPVICDLFSAMFLAIGGGMAIVSVLGRFANMSDDARSLYFPLVKFLLVRGSARETFWKEWAESHKEEVQIDPKTGKPIVKKEEKDKKAKDTKKPDPKAAAVVPPVFAEVVYNVESTAEFPDPNKGPTSALWKSLLDLRFNCQHTWLDEASLLINCIVSGLSWLGEMLISAENIAIDTQDRAGRSAVMYALLLNDSNALRVLLTQGADLNLVDATGFPTIHYAFSTFDEDNFQRSLPGHAATRRIDSVDVLGHVFYLEDVLAGQVDLNVSDHAGYSPLLFSVGMGRLQVEVGGYSFRIRNEAYHNVDYVRENIVKSANMLLASGADVNYCSKSGLTALHVACCRGDIPLVKLLLDCGIHPNGLDSRGCHALHYLFASCPPDSKDLFDMLIKRCNFRPAEKVAFADYRTGKQAQEKEETELSNHLDEALQLCFQPLVLHKYRVQFGELFSLSALEHNVTPMMMLFAGPQFLVDDADIFEMLHVENNKETRIELALHLVAFAEKQQVFHDLMRSNASANITLLHCFSLLLKGMLPKVYLTDREKRAKRVRKFESKETQLLEYVFESHKSSNIDDLYCSWLVKDLGISSPWTPLHAAIVNGNTDLINLLVSNYPSEWPAWLPIHAMCATTVEVTDASIPAAIIKLCADHDLHKTLLNDGHDSFGQLPPVHLAVQNKQYSVIESLVQCTKVDLNQRHPESGMTPIYAACLAHDLELVRAFTSGRDRLDLTLKDTANSWSCVEYVVKERNVDIFLELVKLRKNDVLEQLISEDSSGQSLLKQMEQSHLALLEQEGRAPKSEVVEHTLKGGDTHDPEEQPAVSFQVEPNVDPDESYSEDVVESNKAEEQNDEIPANDEVVKLPSSDGLCSVTNFLKILEDLVNSTGIIEPHHHFHPVYAEDVYLGLVFDY